MEELSRSDYPAMLAHLQPNQAVRTLEDRVKRISKINTEIAEWVAERRRIEDQYVQSLRKLTSYRVPNTHSELGVFQPPWDRLLQSTHTVAQAHHHFATRIEQDVELPLRSLHSRKEMQNMSHISGNLAAMAKELEDAQARSEKLSRRGGKPQKVDEATAKLDSTSQQWEAQAPFIFESLQALDETRCNQLRDLLTQYLTHESDKAQRVQSDAAETLNVILEVDTEKEVQDFSNHIMSGKPKVERRTISARPSIGGSSSLAPPSSIHEDDYSEGSGRIEPTHTESKLRRLGTMLGRRRQSIHGGFGQLSPQRHGARLGSSHGRLSPRASSNNLAEAANRLSSLAEQPNSPDSPVPLTTSGSRLANTTNGIGAESGASDLSPTRKAPNGATESEMQALEATKSNEGEPQKDADGFTVPVITHDPISEAERDAAEANGDTDLFFKVNIQKDPIAEEDADAKQAALSNVATTLTAMGMPARRAGTVRGRRDIRSTILLAGPELTADNPFPTSPAPSQQSPQHPPQAPKPGLASESSIAATSDTQSVRSGNSLASVTHFQHPNIDGPGLSASIIEAVSASFEGGVAKSVKVIGEVALSCNPDSAKDREHIRFNEFSRLESVGPNRIFVHPVDAPGEYEVETSQLAKMTPSFTYKVAGEDNASSLKHLPLIIKSDWRPQGDKLGLLLQYSLNPKWHMATTAGTAGGIHEGVVVGTEEEAPPPVELELQNLVLFASYLGKAAGAQLKPAGTHVKERHVVYWRLGDVRLVAGKWEKLVCRIVGAEGIQPKAGRVKATWEYDNTTTEEAEEMGAGVGAGAGVGELGSGVSLSRFVEGKGKGKGKGKMKEDEEDVGEDKGKGKVVDDDDPFADEMPSSPGLPEQEEREEWQDVLCRVKTIAGRYEAR